MDNKKAILRSIPKIDEVLQEQCLLVFFENTPREVIVDSVREIIEDFRKSILAAEEEKLQPMEYEAIKEQIIERIFERRMKSLRQTINATGVVLHTNLGRARLSKAAAESVTEAALNYSTLEYDVKKGTRGSRHDHVEKIITKITGAESAMMVNNNAAATMLCLSAMAAGREVIVSRGELVEIGGSFRVPDIMAQSGATLREVGTTNKTKISDYKNAVTENTAALMKVHTSNYRILGFTEDVSLSELVALGKELGLPVIYDMGSGLMADLSAYGVDEPTVSASLDVGIDVILFSGDKLLGGPQGGIIAGKKSYVDAMKKHPLARVIRVDKMSIAAMEATFKEYLDPEKALKQIPVLSMLTASYEELRERAEKMARALASQMIRLHVEAADAEEQVGGGSAPTVRLLGAAIAVWGDDRPAEKLERLLRKNDIPIIARINKDKLYIDMRTIDDEEAEIIAQALVKIDKSIGESHE